MDNHAFTFLEKYIDNASPTGYEAKGQQLWRDYISGYVDESYTDAFCNAVAVINPNAEYKVMLEAHADEVSWVVSYIDPSGFLHVIPNGGADFVVAPMHRVFVHTRKGKVNGVFGWPSSSMRVDMPEAKSIDVKDLFIDCGVSSKEEVEKLGVKVGDLVTYQVGLQKLNNKFITGRALDNRVGGLILAEVARKLNEENIELPYALYLVNAAQEEVGMNGAKIVADIIKPDLALVTDVTHDTSTPYIDKNEFGIVNCGSGPVLTVAPTLHRGFMEYIADIADKKKIPYQWKAEKRKSSTDSDALMVSNRGVVTGLVSPPLRYMHTPSEVIHEGDIDNTIKLIYEVLISIKPDELKFTDPQQGVEQPSLKK